MVVPARKSNESYGKMDVRHVRIVTAGRHATRDTCKPGSCAPPPPGLCAGAARGWEAAQAWKRCPIPCVCAKGASEPGCMPKPGGSVPPPLCFACKGGTQTGGCRNRRGACGAMQNEV